MEDVRYPMLKGETEQKPSTVRAMVTIIFRQRRTILLSFAVVLLGAMFAALLTPSEYEAEMKILVRRDRIEPLIAAGDEPVRANPGLTEQDVNSEVDLLQSRDLLQKVVLATRLHEASKQSWAGRLFRGTRSQEERTAAAVEWLSEHLNVQPPQTSNLITVSLRSTNPELAARVLNALAHLYLEKHVSVRRPEGTLELFHREAERYRKELDNLQGKLVEFSARRGTVSAETEKENTLQKLAEFEALQRQLRAEIEQSRKRITSLKKEGVSTPRRITTEIKVRSDSIQELAIALHNLELKRSELLTKYSPEYRPVQDLERQIADARRALAAAQKDPIVEEATNENPTYAWIGAELAKERSALAAQQARAASNARTIDMYRRRTLELDKKSVEQKNLLRAAKTAEDNYVMYMRKKEETRVSQALDRQRIVNVAVADAATVPLLPTSSVWERLTLALLLALVASLGCGFARDYWDASFRTPNEVQEYLKLPVLAALPRWEPLLLRATNEPNDEGLSPSPSN